MGIWCDVCCFGWLFCCYYVDFCLVWCSGYYFGFSNLVILVFSFCVVLFWEVILMYSFDCVGFGISWQWLMVLLLLLFSVICVIIVWLLVWKVQF